MSKLLIKYLISHYAGHVLAIRAGMCRHQASVGTPSQDKTHSITDILDPHSSEGNTVSRIIIIAKFHIKEHVIIIMS